MKKITFEIAFNRFKEQGRNDIQLCEDGFEGWKKKSKFYDFIEKDYFWSIPKNVYTSNSAHPNRGIKKRAQTNLKKYGNACSLHGNTKKAKEVQGKTKKTNTLRYGTENPFQSEEIKKKIKKKIIEKYDVDNISKSKEAKEKKKQTSIKNWGFEHHMHNEEMKNKLTQTNLLKFGVTHPSKNKKVKEKKKNTFLNRYGVSNPFLFPEVRAKSQQTIQEKYGSKTFWGSLAITIEDDNEKLHEWWEKLPMPKLAYSNLCVQVKKYDKVTYDVLDEIIKNYENNKTSLEVSVEKLFEIKHYNRSPKKIKSMCRPDFKLNDTTYLNVDGLYWHCELQKDKWSHFNLRKEFEKAGFRLFQFREDEIRDKSQIIKSIVENALGKTQNKIFARKCEIRKVEHKTAKTFLKENHLMGSTSAKHIGLFYNDKLVSVLSWKCKGSVCKIERFCSKVNVSSIGGFSKLLAHLEKNYLANHITEIHNWVDLRYGTGEHLKNKGFELKKETLGWKWTDGEYTYNRLKCKANMDHRKLSMREHSEELGWFKIYDAGQRLWIKYLN